MLLEHDPAVFDVDDDVVPLAKLTLEHAHGEGVEHPALNRALERSGSVGRFVSLVDEHALGCIGKGYVNLPIFQASHQPTKLNVDDLLEMLAAERVEEDDLVNPVQELRAEVRRGALP